MQYIVYRKLLCEGPAISLIKPYITILQVHIYVVYACKILLQNKQISSLIQFYSNANLIPWLNFNSMYFMLIHPIISIHWIYCNTGCIDALKIGSIPLRITILWIMIQHCIDISSLL